MNSGKELADRFRDMMLSGKYIAFTNVKEQLHDVTVDEANTSINGLNTIAMLTFHLRYYIKGVIQVFEGGDLTIRDKYSFDMNDLENENDWIALRDDLLSSAEKYAAFVEGFDNEKLASGFVKTEYGSYYKNIDGMIEHCYYHFGQIVIIKKMIRSMNS